MRFSLYIAWRYLFAKKTHNAINIITMVSVVGVAVGTMALVVVLSVFNGFEKLIMSLYNAFHADMEITLAEGKTFPMEELPMEELRNIEGVASYSEVLEESGMLSYRDKQHLVTLRGVDDTYKEITGLDTLLSRGEYLLRDGNQDQILLGQGVYYILDVNIKDFRHPLNIYIPRRGQTTGMLPAQAFRSSSNFASGVFAIQTEFDLEYVVVPLRLMRRLLDYDNREVSSLVAGLEPGADNKRVQQKMQEIAGPDFIVKDRLQQQDFLNKIMRSEKWAIFFILTFILIIAAFNVVGSLTMLVIEKRPDISVLRSMGASKKLIHRIFMTEGILISLGGALGGILLGGLLSWIQMRFGLISLQGEGVFIVDAYPVAVQWTDLLMVAVTVFCIGLLASLIPVRNMWKSTEKAPS
ncbi:MAG: FtsX-like permease family protein [Bacteroidales bacterium]